MLGPAFVAAVAYIDLGNVATNLTAGATFGYLLVWVVVAASLVAILVQFQAAKFGLATGLSLPQLCRRRFPRWAAGCCGYRPRLCRSPRTSPSSSARRSGCGCCSGCRSRGEFTDAAMMRDYDRLASLFTTDGALRMPNIPVELAGREQIRAWGDRVPALVDYLVQTTHQGTIALDGDTASGRAYMQELGRARDGRSELNFAIYHDHYQRAPDGWKFTERVYEVRYHDTTPLAGSAPRTAQPRPFQEAS